jgi:cyanosortase A-associated protein
MDNESEISSADPISTQPKSADPKKDKLRFGLLTVLVSSSLLIWARSLVDGSIGQPTLFIFPEQIDFAKAQTQQLVAKPDNIVDSQEFLGKPKYLFGKKYQYSIDGLPIEINLRYAVGTEGSIYSYLKGITDIQISEDQLRQKSIRKDPVGYYATFTHQNRAYLTACINPRGISTVTQEQFIDNASAQAMDREVIVSWLLGQKDLRDRRCLWTLMSTPLNTNSDLGTTNQKLEKIWFLWYEWWQPRFPKP